MKRKSWFILLMAMIVSLMLAACGGDEEATSDGSSEGDFSGNTLNLLVWEGMADEKIISGFEEEHDVKVNATYFGSSDELMAKLKSGGGSTYDVISPSGDLSGYLVASDMLEPLNVENYKNYTDINEDLILEDVQKDGEVYGVPYVWGPNYLIYDADVVKEAPTSWSALGNPEFAGKVSLPDSIDNLYIVGQLMGLNKGDKTAIYNMSEEQLQEAKKILVDLKPQIRKYWATGGELNDLFANKEVTVAVGWPLTVKQVNDTGRNLKWAIPEEGTTGWMDNLMIVKGSKNKELAELYLDYAISPEIQAITAEVTNYAPASVKAAEFMSDDLQEATHIHEMEDMFGKIDFWQYVENRARYNEIWTEVKTN